MDEQTALHLHARRDPGWLTEKTSFGPYWLHREITRRGPGDYLAVTSTFPLMKLKMLPEFLNLFERTFELGSWRAGDRVFEFYEDAAPRMWGYETDTPSRVIFGSATHPESLESATAKGCWADEIGQKEFRLESWQAIQRRLSLNLGRVLGGTTIYNRGWMMVEVYDRWRDGDPDYEVVQFASVLNPAFPKAEFERMKAAYSGANEWKFRMFYLGEYDHPAGLIYQDFKDHYREDGGHLVHPFNIPAEWPRYGGLDFGAVNTARLLAARDPAANVYYLYSESLEGNKTTAEHAADALEAVKGTNMKEWRGGSKSETQQRMDWKRAGVVVKEPVVSDVESGIDRVISLFKDDRLYVFDTLSGLRDELGSYSREVDESGNPTEVIADKAKFHRNDALRYVAQGLSSTTSKAFPVEVGKKSVWRG